MSVIDAWYKCEADVTDVIRIDPGNLDLAALERAAGILRRGGLVAFPTETVYGLGAHALDRAAVRRIFEAKERPSSDPLIVHIASADALAPLVRFIPAAVSRLTPLWPGPLTLVLPRSTAVPDEVTAGLDTVAVRVPAHPVALALLQTARLPIAAPSANRFSRPSPTRAEHVLADLAGRIDLVVDAGPTHLGVESTVLDMTADVPTILRPGAITIERLRTILPDVRMRRVSVSDDAAPQLSPGLLSKHYAPSAPMTLYVGPSPAVLERIRAEARARGEQGLAVGVLAADEDDVAGGGAIVVRYGPERDLEAIAARLYAALRELDAAGVDIILARGVHDTSGLGAAVSDRLGRAASRVVHVPR